MGDANGIIGYDRGTPGLSNAPLHTKQDTDSLEEYPPLELLPLKLPKTYIH